MIGFSMMTCGKGKNHRSAPQQHAAFEPLNFKSALYAVSFVSAEFDRRIFGYQDRPVLIHNIFRDICAVTRGMVRKEMAMIWSATHTKRAAVHRPRTILSE